MRILITVVTAIVISGCGGMGGGSGLNAPPYGYPADANYVCRGGDGLVQINGEWRNCKWDKGVPSLEEVEVSEASVDLNPLNSILN